MRKTRRARARARAWIGWVLAAAAGCSATVDGEVSPYQDPYYGPSGYGDGDAVFNKTVLSTALQYAQFENGALLQRQGEMGLTLSGPLQSTYALNALTRTRHWAGALFDESWGTASATLTARPGLKLGLTLRAVSQLRKRLA